MVGSRMGGNNRSRRVTRANQNTNKYLCKPLPVWKDGFSNNRNRIYNRAEYFRVYRPERTALRFCTNLYINTNSEAEYKANRYIYYVIIPHLAKYLWHPPDREKLLDLEHYVYNQLLSYLFVKGSSGEPNRVLVWKFKSPTYEVGLTQQKL